MFTNLANYGAPPCIHSWLNAMNKARKQHGTAGASPFWSCTELRMRNDEKTLPNNVVEDTITDSQKSFQITTDKVLRCNEWLAGWWFQALWKRWKSVGMIIPNIWKKSHVRNHQPVGIPNQVVGASEDHGLVPYERSTRWKNSSETKKDSSETKRSSSETEQDFSETEDSSETKKSIRNQNMKLSGQRGWRGFWSLVKFKMRHSGQRGWQPSFGF